MPGADGEGHFHLAAQELSDDRRFKRQLSAIAGNQDLRNRTGITVTPLPRNLICWIGGEQPTFLFVLTSKIITIEKTAIDRLVHESSWGQKEQITSCACGLFLSVNERMQRGGRGMGFG
ncbi:MAG: hypothetical protein NZ553_15805 [Caldilinea sp.]|nr:hypothetical protein [Caldilinea sp.]MDW8441941.1 hypothetical protein [Caldilineaceae bacterium]